jgi:hypothetical protein
LIIETGKGCLLANIIGGSVIFEADKYQTVNFVDQDLFENITSEPKFLILQKNEKYGLFDVFLDCVLDFEYSMIKPVRSTRNYTVVFELVKNGKKQLQEIEVNEGIFDF